MSDQPAALAAALTDRYRLERELGQGGMATVYLAEDLRHHRKVAVKVLRPELAAALGPERFLREIETTANLRHPHILPLYDSGEGAGFLFYVMPFVEGESLRDRLQREKQLPIEDALQIAREVADALSYAHSRGVIHRDIKPENILLEAGHAMVADFGIARAISAAGGDRLTETGLAIGTVQYMSPEQAAGEKDLDGRSDLYALGCVLYEMLAGQPPFTGATMESLVYQHLTVEPRAITQLRPAVPAEVAAALQRALAKTPADRFNPVAQFSDALRPGALARPSATIAGPTSRRTSRWRVGIAAIILLAVSLATWLTARGGSGGSAAAAVKTLAVLPFKSVGGDTANAYFAEGMADEVATALAKVPGLQLAGRSSTNRFRERPPTVQEIGRSLNVGAVLQGSVRRAADRMRVSVELANAETGIVMWTESYERELKDVFAVQDDIAGAIVEALRVTLAGGGGVPVRLAGRGTANLAAYDDYLRGLYQFRRRGVSIRTAVENFSAAVAKDSIFARAYAGLGLSLTALTIYTNTPAREVLPGAMAAAERATALDPRSAEGYLALAVTHMYGFRWAPAEAAFQRSTALDSTLALSRLWFGRYLWVMGRVDEAIEQLGRAEALDPLDGNNQGSLAVVLGTAGRYDEAAAAAERAFTLDSTLLTAQTGFMLALVGLGRLPEAHALGERIQRFSSDLISQGTAAYGIGRAGDVARARALTAGIAARGSEWRVHTALTRAYLGIGDTVQTLGEIERALAAGEPFALSMSLASPMYDPVRGSRRFAAAVGRLGLDVSRFTAPNGDGAQ